MLRRLFSIGITSKVELTTLQRSIHKKLDKLKRIKGTMDCGESPLTENKKASVLKCAIAIEVNGEEKLQEIIDFILTKRGNDHILVTKATSSHLQLLNEDVDCYHKTEQWETKWESPEMFTLNSSSTWAREQEAQKKQWVESPCRV
jgi:hypothetical protein